MIKYIYSWVNNFYRDKLGYGRKNFGGAIFLAFLFTFNFLFILRVISKISEGIFFFEWYPVSGVIVAMAVALYMTRPQTQMDLSVNVKEYSKRHPNVQIYSCIYITVSFVLFLISVYFDQPDYT